MLAKWYRTFAMILIPALLIAAWFIAKPHQPKPQQAAATKDRLQWSAKAVQYTKMPTTAGTAKAALTESETLLLIPPDTLEASLQVSLRLKPRGQADAPSVSPTGSGTLTIQGHKLSFLVDSTSVLNRYVLSDGTLYVRGPLDITIQTPQGQQLATLGVSSVPDSGEGLWTYTNPDGQGIVTFGNGFNQEHGKEINAIR